MHSDISVLTVVCFMWRLSEETELAVDNKMSKKVMLFSFSKLRPDTDTADNVCHFI